VPLVTGDDPLSEHPMGFSPSPASARSSLAPLVTGDDPLSEHFNV
jgi:hypothetical protein